MMLGLTSAIAIVALSQAPAPPPIPEGLWLSRDEGFVVRIESCGDGFCGIGVFFRFSPSASWNVFDRRQLKQNVLIADERTTQASLDYEAVVLRALREVEDALAAYAQEQVRSDRLSDAVAAAQQTTDIATQRYNSGLRDFRDVLDAQRSLVTLQDQLASSRSNVSTAVVRLYRALGGGWNTLPPPS